MKEKNYYITTPIYYVNGDPHLGHAHTTVMGDIFKRALGMRGLSVFYTTGVDEHGQKNSEEITKSGLSSESYLDGQCAKFRELFGDLNISYDFFVRTSYVKHKNAVRSVLDNLYKKGLIVKKKYSGLYCPGCEQFKTASDLDENGLCPDHQIRPLEEEEINYFFVLEPHREWLINHIREHKDWISPDIYRNKVLDMLKDPLPDLCVSRPKSRVGLGIELPFDSDYVAYVWFDALINYISSLGYPDKTSLFAERWENSRHLMAKDIIKTHCIYWPIMLKAIGIRPAGGNLIHGFWVGADGRKMSKSLGNGVDPREIIRRYGSDSLRAYLAARMGRNEARIGERLFKDFYNSFFANALGNVYLRSVKLLEKYSGSVIPEVKPLAADNEFLESIHKKAEACSIKSPGFQQISGLMEGLEEIGSELNRYIDFRKPWQISKNAGRDNEMRGILLVCLEGLRLLFEAAWPVIPAASEKVLANLAADCPALGKRHELRSFALPAGKTIAKGEALFPRAE